MADPLKDPAIVEDQAATPEMPADPSLVGVLADLDAAGWTGQTMPLEGGRIRCLTCRAEFAADEVSADHVRRLEGASDPGDMVIVVPLACPSCATKAVLVAHFGPDASPEDADVVAALDRSAAGGSGLGTGPATTG
jgi:hypothetical protein